MAQAFSNLLQYYIILYYIIVYNTVCYCIIQLPEANPATVPNPSWKINTTFRNMASVEHAFLSRRNTTFQDMSSVEHAFVALQRIRLSYF